MQINLALLFIDDRYCDQWTVSLNQYQQIQLIFREFFLPLVLKSKLLLGIPNISNSLCEKKCIHLITFLKFCLFSVIRRAWKRILRKFHNYKLTAAAAFGENNKRFLFTQNIKQSRAHIIVSSRCSRVSHLNLLFCTEISTVVINKDFELVVFTFIFILF